MIYDLDRLSSALPGYSLGDKLGEGSFGVVIAGRHRVMDRPVAIKVVSAGDVAVDFAAEARIMASLDHPHVVRIYECVLDQDLCLVVMELMTGGTLTGRRARLSVRQACVVGVAVANALDHAHSRGVIHRDIKLDNILFAADGTVKVSDFGIAKLYEGTEATASGTSGTPTYMAPEQILRGRIGPATDIYALGIVMYILLSGHPPFDPTQPMFSLLKQHLDTPPAPLVGVPVPLSDVILRALAKNPDERQPNAVAFARELTEAAATAFGADWAAATGIPLYPGNLAPSGPKPPPAYDSALSSGRTAAKPQLDGAASSAVTLHPSARTDPPPGSRPERTLYPPPAARGDAVPDQTRPAYPPPPVRGDAAPDQTRPAYPPPPVRGDAAPDQTRPDRSRLNRRMLLLGGGLAAIVPASVVVADRLAAAGSGSGSPAAAPSSRTAASTLTSRSLPQTPPARPVQVATLRGHTGDVVSVAFSPDGRTLATTSNDTTVRLWDVTAPAAAHAIGAPLIGHRTWLVTAIFSPDGHVLASAGGDATIRLWDVADPTRARPIGTPLSGHTHMVGSLSFDATGRVLASSSQDFTVRLWDVADPARGRGVGMFQPRGLVLAATFAHPGHILFTASEQDNPSAGLMQVWDVTDPGRPTQLGATATIQESNVSSLVVSPSGRLLAVGGLNAESAAVFDITHPAGATQVGEVETGRLMAAAFGGDDALLVAGHAEPTDPQTPGVQVWDIRQPGSARLRTGFPSSGSLPQCVACRPDGRLVAIGHDSVIELWTIGSTG
ncbi:eukaryotic-like serine/threonine-protein kinase [Frankia sp. AiPs1]|uniref:WD40 repeat domain-containing serine/threonine protein kinase n=1 Tax=Frankia sp. AiPa1 TaxID=573492 RepID=UPI00202AE6AD|nr:serine/threonine-protein kinase [Frankia sp. AiPa1]MCL9758228.1 protein kinase [Frankia sp. AiPa1]